MVELSRDEYGSIIMMLTNKDIFGNWIKQYMGRDYHLMNKKTYSNKYAMPLLKEILDAFREANIFSSLDLCYGYRQLSLKEGDKVNTTF
jgi:hypothetical protein